jgi:phage shock protein C
VIGVKRLYKKEDGKIIAGVCAGIAEYFKLDPTVVRLAWLIFSAFAGSGIFIYIVAAIIMPGEYDV